MATNPEQLSFLTKAYNSLQGLRLTPAWLLGVLKPWIDLMPNRPIYLHDYVMLGSLIFCFIWFWISGRWYRKRYGKVEVYSHSQALIVIAALSAFLFASWLDGKNPPVSFMALFFFAALFQMAFMVPKDRIRSVYYSAAAGCMLLAALLPLSGWISVSHLMISPQFWVTFNSLMLIGGVLDHFLLHSRLSQSRRSLNV
jgi:hypothetical protein